MLVGKTRRWFRLFHVTLALASAIWLMLIAATGIILSFRQSLLKAEYPEFFTSTSATGPVAGANINSWIENTDPWGGDVAYIHAPFGSSMPIGAPIVIRTAPTEAPDTLQYLAIVNNNVVRVFPERSLAMLPVFLHTTLLLPGGDIINVILAICALIVITSGVTLWWPRQGRIRQSLKLRHNMPPRMKLRTLHVWAGLSILPLLTIIFVTGQLIWLFLWFPPQSHVSVKACDSAISLADSIDALLEKQPGHEVATIFLSDEKANITLRPWPAHNATQRGITTFTVTSCGDAMPVDNWINGFQYRLTPWLVPLHGGRILGWAGKSIVIAAALSLAFLLVTGLINWLSAKAQK